MTSFFNPDDFDRVNMQGYPEKRRQDASDAANEKLQSFIDLINSENYFEKCDHEKIVVIDNLVRCENCNKELELKRRRKNVTIR